MRTPPEKTVLELACSGDLPAIVKLHLDTRAYLASIAPPGYAVGLADSADADELDAYFAEALTDDQSRCLVARVGEEFAGYALARIEEHADDLVNAPFTTVEFIGVVPEFRRRGIAQALLAEVEAWAAAQGIDCIDLLVWDANASAQSFFHAAGYAPLEHRLTKRLSGTPRTP